MPEVNKAVENGTPSKTKETAVVTINRILGSKPFEAPSNIFRIQTTISGKTNTPKEPKLR